MPRVVCAPLSFGEHRGEGEFAQTLPPDQQVQTEDRPHAYLPRKGFFFSVFLLCEDLLWVWMWVSLSLHTLAWHRATRGLHPCPQPGEHFTALLDDASFPQGMHSRVTNRPEDVGPRQDRPHPSAPSPPPVPPMSPLPVPRANTRHRAGPRP